MASRIFPKEGNSSNLDSRKRKHASGEGLKKEGAKHAGKKLDAKKKKYTGKLSLKLKVLPT